MEPTRDGNHRSSLTSDHLFFSDFPQSFVIKTFGHKYSYSRIVISQYHILVYLIDVMIVSFSDTSR